MPKVFFFNYVTNDGKGDFKHLCDIVAAIKNNPALSNFELHAVVDIGERWKKENFEDKLRDLGLTRNYINDPEDKPWENPELQNDLSQAVQIIQVSSNSLPNRDKYLAFVKAGTLYKYFGEHEGYNPLLPSTPKLGPIIVRSMGLGVNTYGIKINKSMVNPLLNPFSIIAKHDNAFFTTLMTNTNSANAEEFQASNLFLPAYFNKTRAFQHFLLLLMSNTQLPSDKDISVFVSTSVKDCKKIISELNIDKHKDIIANFSQIEVIEANGALTRHLLNPVKTRALRLFSGFKLSDESFNTLFHCASFAAFVTGDNTFEMTISRKEIFPFYCSTNFDFKVNTLKSLEEIIKKVTAEKGVPVKVASDMLLLFNYEKFVRFEDPWRTKSSMDSILGEYKNIDFVAMAKAWHAVSDYIIENHNFYAKLPELFLEGLDPSLQLTPLNDESEPRNTFQKR